MKFGRDFFKILNIVVRLVRMFAEVFGDDDDKKEAMESRIRSANSDSDDVA